MITNNLLSPLRELRCPKFKNFKNLIHLISFLFISIFSFWPHLVLITFRENKISYIFFNLLIKLRVSCICNNFHIFISTHIVIVMNIIRRTLFKEYIFVLFMNLSSHEILPKANSEIIRYSIFNQIPNINIFPWLVFFPLTSKYYRKFSSLQSSNSWSRLIFNLISSWCGKVILSFNWFLIPWSLSVFLTNHMCSVCQFRSNWFQFIFHKSFFHWWFHKIIHKFLPK